MHRRRAEQLVDLAAFDSVQNLVQPSEIGASALIDTRQLDQTALIQQIATDPGFAELAPGPLVALRRLAVRGRAAHR